MDELSNFQSQYDDNTPGGDGLFRINWYNGDPKLRTPGTFFVSAKRLERYGVEPPGAPWKEDERTFNSGQSERGWSCAHTRLQILGLRRQECVLDGEGRVTRWIDGYTPKEMRPQGWSIYVEMLLATPGFKQPVVWAAKRIRTSMAMLTIARDHVTRVVDPARRLYRNPKIPIYAFWAQVRCALDAKGGVVYEKTIGAPVTPPMLVVPDMELKEMLRTLYVGKELLDWGEEQRGVYDAWLRQTPGEARRAQVREEESAPAIDSPADYF